ncbi:MAG TPA: tetratricopeptide repeat protein [Candidatus Binataceae bacterium]|nr:tetratricopeptide repeat protein [Candidatus Binataceae bacterium]
MMTGEGGLTRSQTFSTRAAARILAVPAHRIRYWVRQDLVSPAAARGRRYRFAFNDLLMMRLAKDLLPTRGRLEPFQRCFAKVRNFFEPTRSVTSLRLDTLDGRIVVRDGDAAFEAESGQMLLQFHAPPRPLGKVEDGFGPARVRERFEETRLLAENDPIKALTLYGDLLAHEPRNLEAHLRMATVLENKNDSAGAIRHLQAAALILPGNTEVHLRLGLLYRHTGDLDNAIESLLRATACDPLSIAAHRNLADIYEETGRRREALRHLSAINRLNRDHQL